MPNQRRTQKEKSRIHSATRHRERESIPVIQFAVCLLVFFAVLAGKGIMPEKITALQENIRTLVTSDVDYYSAFTKLGMSISENRHTLENMEAFCVEVFSGAKPEPDKEVESVQSEYPLPDFRSALTQEVGFLCSAQSADLLTHYWQVDFEPSQDNTPDAEATEPAPSTADESGAEEETVPAIGAVLLTPEYSGRPLPANYTMDMLSLGTMETVTPVFGNLNSEYGYRDHPINGKYLFHGGVDIGGQTGDPIVAFAAGTVDYVGENKSYGLYLQVDHGNGIKSFYAHCSKITVKKGQQVAAGEKIAEVGSSGSATGPHLHLELKYGGTHLNPAYYLTFLNA